MFRKNQFRIKGFTLIEVLVVLSIIAVQIVMISLNHEEAFLGKWSLTDCGI